MQLDLSRHPSDIAQAASQYLATANLPTETLRLSRQVIALFIESLQTDPAAIVEGTEGESLLHKNWDACTDREISVFMEQWLPAQGHLEAALTPASPILRRWITWCYDHNFFGKTSRDAFLAALAPNHIENRRVQRAAELLFLLHTPHPEAWKSCDHDRVVSIKRNQRPEKCAHGLMPVLALEHDRGYLENPQGEKAGPVLMGPDLAAVLKVGDIVDVTIGRFNGIWNVLTSGAVYAEEGMADC